MIRRTGYAWHLRLRMAERGMYATTDLVPLLAERGVHLSREQVFRLVTQPPQRLSMDTLAALCDIVVRLADHRLMLIEVCCSPPGSEKVAEQVRHYRQLASDLLRSAAASPPEPDWGAVAEKLRSVGPTPLDFPTLPGE